MPDRRTCRSCGKAVVWITMVSSGRPMPIDADTIEQRVVLNGDRTQGAMRACGVSHFATCPSATTHRKVAAPTRSDKMSVFTEIRRLEGQLTSANLEAVRSHTKIRAVRKNTPMFKMISYRDALATWIDDYGTDDPYPEPGSDLHLDEETS